MNMKLNLTAVASIFSMCCMACTGDVVTVKYNGQTVEVSEVSPSDSLIVKTEGTNVYVENISNEKTATIRLSGQTDNGQFVLKTKTKDKIELDDVKLQSAEGAPLWIKNKKKVEVKALDGTDNALIVTACKDTANLKAAVIYAKDKLLLSGKGKLLCLAPGDGCKGINAKDDITIEEITLDVKTTGNNLGKDERGFGGFGGGFPGGGPGGEGRPEGAPDGFGGPGGFPGGGPGGFNFDDMPEEVKKQFEEMRKRFENGEFPMGGPGGPGFPGGPGGPGGEGGPGGFPGGFGGPMGGGFGGGFAQAGPPQGEGPEPVEGGGFKQKYLYTCKGIKSTGTITINSGNVTVYTTSAGAEGIEGKKGVTINGGTVDVNACDDAINANGPISFNGGKTIALSRHNDAVDANPEGGFMFPGMFGGQGGEQKEPDPLIFIGGGEVYAYSWVGSPEEGMDCDFNPIAVTGGTAFSIGAGMGDMPSVPTAKTAKQPTALIIGLNLQKGKPVVVKNNKGKEIFSTQAPFSFNNSSSIFTCDKLQIGEKYTIECGDCKKEFEMKETFVVVR